jgi:hypothetical protein
MSEFAQQLDEALRQGMRVWKARYLCPWPIFRALVNGYFLDAQAKAIFKPWQEACSQSAEWQTYFKQRLVAICQEVFTVEEVEEACDHIRNEHILRLHQFYRGELSSDRLERGRQRALAVREWFSNVKVTVPLVEVKHEHSSP